PALGPEAHRGGYIDDGMHRYARSLPVYADQPLLLNVPQTGPQVEAPRIGPVVQTQMRNEFLTSTQTGSAMRSGPPSTDAVRQPIVELAVFAHGYRGVGTRSRTCEMSRSAISARRNS